MQLEVMPYSSTGRCVQHTTSAGHADLFSSTFLLLRESHSHFLFLLFFGFVYLISPSKSPVQSPRYVSESSALRDWELIWILTFGY